MDSSRASVTVTTQKAKEMLDDYYSKGYGYSATYDFKENTIVHIPEEIFEEKRQEK